MESRSNHMKDHCGIHMYDDGSLFGEFLYGDFFYSCIILLLILATLLFLWLYIPVMKKCRRYTGSSKSLLPSLQKDEAYCMLFLVLTLVFSVQSLLMVFNSVACYRTID